jgi:hypothetical protein
LKPDVATQLHRRRCCCVLDVVFFAELFLLLLLLLLLMLSMWLSVFIFKPQAKKKVLMLTLTEFVSLLSLPPTVNFINVLRAHFLYKSLFLAKL